MGQDPQFVAMTTISRHLRAGRTEQARQCVAEFVVNFQTEWSARSFAAGCFERLGDPNRAWIEAGIALALDPNNYAMCKRFARYLERAGQRDAAQRVLTHGWEQAKKHYPKKRWADERALYFAFSAADLPPRLAESLRTVRAQMAADMKYFEDTYLKDSTDDGQPHD